jgi:uroporphyrinogen III methyltransferase/synthase
VVADQLEAAGARVDQIVVYGSVDVEDPSPDVAEALRSGTIDWITLTSPATARSQIRLYGDAVRRARLASISPLTSTALRDLGYEPAAEATPHTSAGLVDAILRAGKTDG